MQVPMQPCQVSRIQRIPVSYRSPSEQLRFLISDSNGLELLLNTSKSNFLPAILNILACVCFSLEPSCHSAGRFWDT